LKLKSGAIFSFEQFRDHISYFHPASSVASFEALFQMFDSNFDRRRIILWQLLHQQECQHFSANEVAQV
jgi:hypothetical protein